MISMLVKIKIKMWSISMNICEYAYLGLIYCSLYRFSSSLFLKLICYSHRHTQKIPFSKGTGTDSSSILSSGSCLVWLAARLAHCETQRLLPDAGVPSYGRKRGNMIMQSGQTWFSWKRIPVSHINLSHKAILKPQIPILSLI